MLDTRNVPVNVMVIPHFEKLATASTLAFGGGRAGIIILQEDFDTISGDPQLAEADRVARMVLSEPARQEAPRRAAQR